MEHPKDIGDVSTLAITLILRALGHGLYAHHKSAQYQQRSYHGEIDLFAVYCPETAAVLPSSDRAPSCPAPRSLRVEPPKNNQIDRIRFAADYEIGRVAIEGLRVSSGA
jgi:hypothetical protein